MGNLVFPHINSTSLDSIRTTYTIDVTQKLKHDTYFRDY